MSSFIKTKEWKIINDNCLDIMKNRISHKVDIVFTDPPFGIGFKTNMNIYNRKKSNVVGNYNEVNLENYYKFTGEWIKLANNLLKDNGIFWVISGWTNDWMIKRHCLKQGLTLVNEIIWKHNFAMWNKVKFVSSHYVMSFFVKNPKDYNFNSTCRFPIVKGKGKNKKNYADRLSVWEIPKEYRVNQEKTPNMLPTELVKKIIQYIAKDRDIILDCFMGSGNIGKVANELNCRYIGIERDKDIFDFAHRNLLGEV